jgi:hypothetical protein
MSAVTDLSPVHLLLAVRTPRARVAVGRLPDFVVPAIAFAAYLTAAAWASLLPTTAPARAVGAVTLVGVAAVIGWWSRPTVALAVGAFGWFFWSGFMTHGDGRLGVVGAADAWVLVGLVTAAGGASLIRLLLAPPRT